VVVNDVRSRVDHTGDGLALGVRQRDALEPSVVDVMPICEVGTTSVAATSGL